VVGFLPGRPVEAGGDRVLSRQKTHTACFNPAKVIFGKEKIKMDDQNRKLAGLILNCRPDELRGASLRADGSLAVVAPNGMKFIFSPVELENARDSFGLKAEPRDLEEAGRLLRQAQQPKAQQAQQTKAQQAQRSAKQKERSL
jgi:hypothetical protein